MRRTSIRDDGGSALAEFAVIAPLVLVLLIGSIEVGRFAQYSILVAGSARAGVQYGSQNLVTALDLTGMQNSALADGQNVAGLTATATQYCQCADGTTSSCLPTDCAASHRLVYVRVDTAGVIPSLLHMPGLPATYSVGGHAVMRVRQ